MLIATIPTYYDTLLIEADMYSDHTICVAYDAFQVLSPYIYSQYPPEMSMEKQMFVYEGSIPPDAPDFDRILLEAMHSGWHQAIQDSMQKLRINGGRLTAVIPSDWENNRRFKDWLLWKVGFYDMVEIGEHCVLSIRT